MKPIAGYALLQAREEGRRVSRLHVIMRQFVAYVLFLWVVLALNYTTHNNKAYNLTTAIRQDFIVPHNQSHLTNIHR